MLSSDGQPGRGRDAVLVTGANRGIGRALVEEALARGAERVYAATRQPVTHPDSRVTPLVFDLTDAAQVRAAAGKVESLDILVNNAGLALYDDLSDPAVIERHLAVNLFGTHAVTQAFLPLLTRSRGAIVNVLSTAALAAIPVIPAYSISKAAAFSMSQSLRALLAGQGVRVHAVMTGPTDTDMSRGLDIPKASPQSVARAIFDGVRERRGGDLPRSHVGVPGAGLERRRGQGDGTPERGTRHGSARRVLNDRASTTKPERINEEDSFTTTFTVDQSPAEAFAAINNVRGWWSGEIDGRTDELGAQFTYRYQDIHRSKQEITELIPASGSPGTCLTATSASSRTHRVDGHRHHVRHRGNGSGTEVRFTHAGLVPQGECFDTCSNAWSFYINTSLRNLITTGAGQPNEKEHASR